MAKETIKEMLQMIDAKIEHIEDINADNRAIIVKLVKQNNQIVTFLKQLEIEVDDSYDNMMQPTLSEEEKTKLKKHAGLKELVEQYMEKAKDLKEFEEELKKHKDELTPGTIGES